MPVSLTEVCTCDDNVDTPCPRHHRENMLRASENERHRSI